MDETPQGIETKPHRSPRPRAFCLKGVKEPSRTQNPGGKIRFEIFGEMCLNHQMAKYGQTGHCTKCGLPARVSTVVVEGETHQTYNGTYQSPSTAWVTVECMCKAQGFSTTSTSTNPKPKETPVTKTFDTTTEKSMALSNTMNRVRKLETALFNRAEALAKVDAEHNKHITEASVALDRVLIEAWQSGVNMEEFDRLLPEYADKLKTRLEEVVAIISLANAELPV
jgi:hypothetical protein